MLKKHVSVAQTMARGPHAARQDVLCSQRYYLSKIKRINVKVNADVLLGMVLTLSNVTMAALDILM
jgi:hypothetical protein